MQSILWIKQHLLEVNEKLFIENRLFSVFFFF